MKLRSKNQIADKCRKILQLAFFGSFISILGCSIHIGNPSDFDGKEKKAKPNISIILSGNNMEEQEELQLSLSSLELVSNSGETIHSIQEEPQFEIKATKTNKWLTPLLSNREINSGVYSSIQLQFRDGVIGHLLSGDQMVPVLRDSNLEYYQVSANITADDGKRITAYITFDKATLLSPQISEQGEITSYILKNRFEAREILVSEIEEGLSSDELENRGAEVLPITEGRIVHYDGTNLDSMYVDQSCSIPATIEGDTIGCWKDLSGNSHHLSQEESDRRPRLRAQAAQSRPSLEFDGNNDRFSLQLNTAEISAHSVVFVGNFYDTLRNQRFYSIGGNDINTYSGAGSENGSLVFSFYRNDIFFTPVPQGLPAFIVLTFSGGEASNTTRAAYINGVQQPIITTAQNGGLLQIPAAPNLTIGGSSSNNVQRFQGTFSEIIVFDRELSQDEIKTTFDHLYKKYSP